MKKFTVPEIYQRLKKVIDPETNLNIVDMGLIYEVQIIPAQASDQQTHDQLIITYTLTTPGCPLAGTLHQMILQEMESLKSESFDPERDIFLQLTFDPPWTLECMSEEARAELGFD